MALEDLQKIFGNDSPDPIFHWLLNKAGEVKKEERHFFTYIAFDNKSGYYKFGRSSQVEKREKQLRTSNPNLHILYVCGDNIETLLKQTYKSNNVDGEWFNLDAETVSNIVAEYNFNSYDNANNKSHS